MPRALRVTVRGKPTRPGRSQLASSRLRPLIGNVEARLGTDEKLREVKSSGNQSSEKHGGSEVEGNLPAYASAPSTANEIDLGGKDHTVETSQSSSDREESSSERNSQSSSQQAFVSDTSESILRIVPPPAENADGSRPLQRSTDRTSSNSSDRPSLPSSSFGSIELDSPRTSPFFSSQLGGVGPKGASEPTTSKTIKHRNVDSGPRSSETPMAWKVDGSSSPGRPAPAIPKVGNIGLDPRKNWPNTSPAQYTHRKLDLGSDSSQTHKGRLAGRKCLVTGATSGIGNCFSVQF
jgi:hypothetical protein